MKYLEWVVLGFFAMALGLFIGKQLFRPCIPIDLIKAAPQQYADRTLDVQGVVHNLQSLEGIWKSYELCDTLTGTCITVKTQRSILPPEHCILRIRATLNEPVVWWGTRTLILIEV